MIDIVRSIHRIFGLTGDVTQNQAYCFLGFFIILILSFILLIQFISILSLLRELKEEEKLEKPVSEEPGPKGPSWKDRLKNGLRRSRSEVWGKLGQVFKGRVLDSEVMEELEEILYGADIGPDTVKELLNELEQEFGGKEMEIEDFKRFLFNFLKDKMAPFQKNVDTSLYQFDSGNNGKTRTIMVVGVNGAGKTTTIGKLATRLTRQGAKVVVGACDTFRAAAVDQLQVWCERAGAQMVRAKDGTNPSGVAYEALDLAMRNKVDYCILDTAGRLHTSGNLMDELAKNKRVLKKLDEDAPHQTLLVLDAITGQNAIRQAEEFHRILDISGLIFTKCDGSSKAGSAIPIVRRLQVPISYIGVGETVEDLDVFEIDDYLNALLDM